MQLLQGAQLPQREVSRGQLPPNELTTSAPQPSPQPHVHTEPEDTTGQARVRKSRVDRQQRTASQPPDVPPQTQLCLLRHHSCLSSLFRRHSCLSSLLRRHSCLPCLLRCHSCLPCLLRRHSRLPSPLAQPRRCHR